MNNLAIGIIAVVILALVSFTIGAIYSAIEQKLTLARLYNAIKNDKKLITLYTLFGSMIILSTALSFVVLLLIGEIVGGIL